MSDTFRPAIVMRPFASVFEGPPLAVVKVGGALLRHEAPRDTALAERLTQLGASLRALTATHRVLVVPGGGAFADVVRSAQPRVGASDDAAHWMALLAMDQLAHLLADRLALPLVERYGEIGPALADGAPVVLAPARWMRDADTLPHSWEVTSDSIAAFIAGALDAERLILLKRRTGPLADLVDPAFARVAPVHLRVEVQTIPTDGAQPAAARGPLGGER